MMETCKKIILTLALITTASNAAVLVKEVKKVQDTPGSDIDWVPDTAPGVQQEEKAVTPEEKAFNDKENENKAVGESKPGKEKRNMPASAVDDNGRYVGLYNTDCSETFLLTPETPKVEIEVDRDILKSGSTCHWNIIGTDTCSPVVTCKKFELESAKPGSDDPCHDEYLEVTDGSMGYKKFCGTQAPSHITPARKLRDLYITLRLNSASNIKKREFKCTVSCSDKAGAVTTLPDTSEPEIDEECFCGRKPNANRIVGGEDAKRGEFPWMAALVTAPTRRPFCGGSLISDRLVVQTGFNQLQPYLSLTAAHCFKGPYMKSKNIHVLLNGHNLDLTQASSAKGEKIQKQLRTNEEIKALDEKEKTLRFTVEKYFIHPLYVRQTNDFDVALIKLDHEVDMHKNKHVSPICLPALNSYKESKEGVAAVVAGWGLNSSDATVTQGTLQKLNLNVMENAECLKYFDQRFTKRMMCAGFKEGGKDSCKGDSGGPLISLKTKQIWEQIGIVSWGEGCGQANSPGVYANTREVIQWIRYIVNMEGSSMCQG